MVLFVVGTQVIDFLAAYVTSAGPGPQGYLFQIGNKEGPNGSKVQINPFVFNAFLFWEFFHFPNWE
jgi:hypothetical protein